MIPLSEVRVLDANAEALGVPVARLIENAGRAVADEVQRLAPDGPILVLAGPGNNGADGHAAAKILRERGVRAEVLSTRDPHSAQHVEAQVARAALVVDALLGAGIDGPLREPIASWVHALARHRAKVLAVDVPTGFAYVPGATITFHDIKEGMTEANAGRIKVADVGIPPEAARYTGPGEYLLYPSARLDQHKGEGGIVLVIGGGPYTGAPAVAGMAALRSGADLAIVLTPKRAWQVIASYSPNLVVRPLERDELDFEDPSNRVALNTWLKKARSVVIGPGIGLYDTTQRAVHHVLERAAAAGVPVVVDADALSALATRQELMGPNMVLTPHAREFRTIAGVALPRDTDVSSGPRPHAAGGRVTDERAEAARLAAEKSRATFLVKGPVDIITDGSRVKLNATGHPAMSVGGTGDALAGVVGTLLAKGMTPFDAARVAARLVGEAGERAAAEKSLGLLATDVVEALPGILVRHLSSRKAA